MNENHIYRMVLRSFSCCSNLTFCSMNSSGSTLIIPLKGWSNAYISISTNVITKVNDPLIKEWAQKLPVPNKKLYPMVMAAPINSTSHKYVGMSDRDS